MKTKMANKITSVKGFLGTVDHYDQYGKCVGHSISPDEWMFVHYDAHWNRIGTSSQGFLGTYENYDEHYNRIGSSIKSAFGAIEHYDEHWKKVGTTYDAFLTKESYLDVSPEDYFDTDEEMDF